MKNPLSLRQLNRKSVKRNDNEFIAAVGCEGDSDRRAGLGESSRYKSEAAEKVCCGVQLDDGKLISMPEQSETHSVCLARCSPKCSSRLESLRLPQSQPPLEVAPPATFWKPLEAMSRLPSTFRSGSRKTQWSPEMFSGKSLQVSVRARAAFSDSHGACRPLLNQPPRYGDVYRSH